MSPARALLAGAGAVLLVGLALLVAAGASDRRGTAFSSNAPAAGPAAILGTGRSSCEHPLSAPTRLAAVTVWTSPAVPARSAQLEVRPAGGPALTAELSAVDGEGEFAYHAARAVLPRTLGPGRVTVCVTWHGAGQLVLAGASAVALATVFDAPRPPSLLGALPRALSRASLFHPGWVGPWTFWALLGALLLALLLVVATAARSLRGGDLSDARPTSRRSR